MAQTGALEPCLIHDESLITARFGSHEPTRSLLAQPAGVIASRPTTSEIAARGQLGYNIVFCMQLACYILSGLVCLFTEQALVAASFKALIFTCCQLVYKYRASSATASSAKIDILGRRFRQAVDRFLVQRAFSVCRVVFAAEQREDIHSRAAIKD